MAELFPDGETDGEDAEEADEFITVFQEVNKIFARQTDSRLDVSDIAAQPLVSRSGSCKPQPGFVLPFYLLAKYFVPYLL